MALVFLFVLSFGATGWAANFPAMGGVGQVRGSANLKGAKINPKALPTPVITSYSRSSVHLGQELYVYGKHLGSSARGLRAYLHNNSSSWSIPIANWSARGTGFNTRIDHADAGRYEVNIIANGKLLAHGPMTLMLVKP